MLFKLLVQKYSIRINIWDLNNNVLLGLIVLIRKPHHSMRPGNQIFKL